MKHKFTFAFLAALLTITGLTLIHPQLAHADFTHNRIIDDAMFDNIYTMGAGQIDTFLNQFPSSCISTNHGFGAPDPIGYSPNSGFEYGAVTTAGRVIADAAQAYGINPQVLLTTLQKEQGLVSGGNGCGTLAYSGAMGYGCPDSGTTHSYSGVTLYSINSVPVTSVSGTCVNSVSKVGFSQQVVHAAWLLKFGEQRSEGNIGWAVIKGDWDNSDDPQSCYSGPMTQGYRQICPSGATTYYDGYTTIDGVSTHMDTGATAALYWYTPHFSGNQNFVTLFTNWFGNTTLPYAFKSPTSAAVYMYVNGAKVSVPYMGMLQDYGVSPESIQTLPQSTIDAIPTPTDGTSTSLSYIVKSPSDTDADGGSLYLITIDHRYAFTSMQQFADFGFNQANIAYLPLSFIQSIPSGGSLSNYIQAPNSSVFQVSGGQKRIIFDYPTYQQVNPSGTYTPASYYMTGLVPSGKPIANRDIIVKYNNDATAYLLINGSYYVIPTFDMFNCWGFSGPAHNTPIYQVADNSYISTISASAALSGCVVNDNAGHNYLLGYNIKYQIPSAYGLAGATGMSSDLVTFMNQLPTASAPLKQYIKSNQGNGIWYVQGGMRRTVPTYSDYLLLGLDPSKFDTIDNSVMSSVQPSSVDVKLADGQVVKSNSSGTVYVISGATRIPYATSASFLAYGNDWSNIETYSQTTLDTDYPVSGTSVPPYLYDGGSGKVYVVDQQGCYALTSDQLASFGQTQSGISSAQSYTPAIFPRLALPNCQQASVYVKSPDQAVVYWVDNGQKHPITGWNALVAKSGQSNPYIITLSTSFLGTIPTGSSI
ncbi:MAG TPA: hypothetical protein VLG11_03385 [Candidatus Saccharimonadales bacterium]|nr:hypothetical protein [Candidatus Saccharimonadales bacterium]